MKFDRRQRFAGLQCPPSQPQRELSRAPLLAEQARTPAPFDLHIQARLRDQCARDSEQRMRDLLARVWRGARRDVRRASPEQQLAIRVGWETWTGERTANFFRYVVDLHTGAMTQRYPVFGAHKVLARDELIRSLQMQRALPCDPTTDRRNG